MADQEINDKNIALAWQKLVDKKFSNPLIKKDEIMTAIKIESHSTIAEIKKRLKYKLFWSVGFTLVFTVILLFFLNNQDMVLLLGLGIAAYLIGSVMMYLEYRKIDEGISLSGNILESMKYNVRLIKSVLRLEKTWGIVFFIPAIMIGILIGRVLDGYSLVACFQDPKILTTILIAVFIFTPLLIWASHKMNKFAFGKHLKKLESNIIKMETLQSV